MRSVRSDFRLSFGLLITIILASCTPPQVVEQYTDFKVWLFEQDEILWNQPVRDREIKDFTYACLRDMYYWNDKVPTTIVPSTLASPEAVLAAGQYKSVDRLSFLVKEGSAYLRSTATGESISYGLSVKFTASDDLRVALVESGSPASEAGLKRGMKILKVNNQTLRNFEGVDYFAPKYFPTLTLEIDSSGVVVSKYLLPTTFNKKTALKSFVTTIAGKNVGYLLFTSFTDSGVDELEAVFANFKAQNVTELILDLRYNLGGRVATSQRLASLIATQLSGTVFVRQARNARYSVLNSELTFESRQNALALKRLFVIMTGNTASASELIINGLKPHIEVITIGSKSYGKNTTYYPILHPKSDYVIAIVNALSQNSLGDGNYSNGFIPTRSEEDDVTNDFGDPKEKCYAAAIAYITKGSFPTLTAKRQAEITSSANNRLIRDDRFMDIPSSILPPPKGWQR